MLEFKNIDLSFGDQKLFDNFNYTANKGDIILLNGPSGQGKSTFMKMIPGFVKPDKGEILLDGIKLERSSLKDFRSRISYISQDVDLRDDVIKSLLEEIFRYKINRHLSSPMDRFSAYLPEFLLDQNILEKKVHELSGGERQRVGLILCLVMDRDIWLLDEVTSALDQTLKEKTVEIFTQSDKTLFVVSHDPQWDSLPRKRILRW